MATSRRRTRLVTLVVAGLAGVLGAVVVARAVDDPADDTIRLSTPGEYVEPGMDPNPSLTGGAFPVVELLAVDGAVVSLPGDDGRPMVVNLWYSTCPPCARELTDFADVHDEVADRVRFVGVDPVDSVDEMRGFAADRGVTYELLRDPDSALANALGIVAYPVTLFVDADGTIVDQTGPIDASELRQRIEELG